MATKKMTAKQRQERSERMKQIWAERKAKSQQANEAGTSGVYPLDDEEKVFSYRAAREARELAFRDGEEAGRKVALAEVMQALVTAIARRG